MLQHRLADVVAVQLVAFLGACERHEMMNKSRKKNHPAREDGVVIVHWEDRKEGRSICFSFCDASCADVSCAYES